MSLGEIPLASAPIAWAPFTPSPPSETPYFDGTQTVLSQYANSPILLSILADMVAWLDPGSRFDAFYSLVWDIDTAQGWGLDVWGRILGVGRVLQVPVGEFLGFESSASAMPFGFGIFYSGSRATDNAVLTDEAYRTLLLAKAALNITNASIPAINSILLNLFGQGYVRDNLDMTITYVFDVALSPVENAIVYQSGVLPKPCGVSFSVEEP